MCFDCHVRVVGELYAWFVTYNTHDTHTCGVCVVCHKSYASRTHSSLQPMHKSTNRRNVKLKVSKYSHRLTVFECEHANKK